MNKEDEPLCIDIFASFTNIDHMLKCKNRHYLLYQQNRKSASYTWKSICRFEIVDVLSPIFFKVCKIMHKNTNGVWCSDNIERFRSFSEELNRECTKSFIPIRNKTELNKNTLYVFRNDNQYQRCQVLNTWLVFLLINMNKLFNLQIHTLGQ